MTEKERDRAITLVRRLVRLHNIAKVIAEELCEALESWDGLEGLAGELANLLGSEEDPASLFDRPITDAGAMTVTWGGHTCRLSQMVLFRLMERLARRPGQYIPYDRLLRDVWDNRRSDAAIRSAVRLLREQLRGAQMPGLAEAIKATNRHMALILDETP
jgi:DNA-binding response OmpR family regulator